MLKFIKMWEICCCSCKSCGSEESFAGNTISRFRSPKIGEEESKLLQGSIPKSTAKKPNGRLKLFTNGR